jgi:hypothetical protein
MSAIWSLTVAAALSIAANVLKGPAAVLPVLLIAAPQTSI